VDPVAGKTGGAADAFDVRQYASPLEHLQGTNVGDTLHAAALEY